MALYTVNITDGTTLANLAVSAGRGPKGDGWTGVTYDNGTGRFTFTSTDGLGYVSDSITGDLDTAVTEAEAAQAAAEAAQAATENIFDQFGDQYLGPKASDPTVDNDGDPLTEGDIYFNTTDDVLKFYSGTAWVAPESIATTAANEAEASATAAATSETNAASSASAASTSETNAASSASAASTSETNAATSETNAASSASAASTSETNAAASETAAAASEAAAAASETAAATSESNAASSASAASTSASNAATSETNAASSASAASTSETNAANSASAAASSYDQFDDRYLGSKSSAPTVDNDGNALLTGALYWDSTLGGLYVWNSTSWEIAGQRDELLQAVAATKSDTAVDVFVYDTSKDSDGGAWRKRTQATSWYNETLNTATRGSRKEFPAVAVIVAETTQLTIYDGDDPDLPMWMVFTCITNGIPNASSSYPLNGAVFKNGVMAIASTGYGAYTINMISDGGVCYRTQNGYTFAGDFKGTISQRNEAQGFAKNLTSFIVNNSANDVAMTVLPNAPIDSATGLPVPTIAVATDGGVSVIKDDGTVVDLTYTASVSNEAGGVWFPASGGIAWQSRSSGLGYVYTLVENEIPTADKSTASDALYANFGQENFVGNDLVTLGTSQPRDFVDGKIGSPNGLTHLDENRTLPANGMVAYTTPTYNTGWMNGAIKLATLSDTDDTDVTGSDLVSSMTFYQTDRLTSYTYTNGGTTVVMDDDEATDPGYVGFDLGGLTAGKTYTISFIADNADSSSYPNRVDAATSVSSTQSGTANEQSITFIASATTNRLFLYSNYSGGNLTYTLNRLSLAEEDRSVNGNGLQVFGSITKDPVATGADLVAYSGFNANNYLQQPYNADLDFGTGDFCVMGWFKIVNATTAERLVVRQIVGGSISFRIQSASSTGDLQIRLSTTTYDTSTSVTDNNWKHIVAVRSSGNLYAYINGVEYNLGAATDDVDVGTSPLFVGVDANGAGSSDSTYMALLRISATAPSPEQIAKIYEDEKVLFQENAQATLYGSSDAVTALAYDDSTELLHVGTSAGRSDFQGLRRVNNTTNAVGAAISASNGMIVEE